MSASEDQKVRNLLAKADRRKAKELKEMKAGFSRFLLIAIPVAVLVLVATAYLRGGLSHSPPFEKKPTTAGASSGEDQVLAKLNQLGANQGSRAGTPTSGLHDGKLMKKEDVQFAMELLNFMQPESKPPPGK